MDETLLKIRLEALGGDNLANLRKLKKEYEAAFAISIRGTPEFQKNAEGLAYIKNQITDVAKVAETANAKMMRSYFQLGQELRSARMAQINFSRVLQDAPFGFMAIQNNIEPLLTSLQSLKQEAEAAGTSFKKALIDSLIGPGAAIGVFAMAIPLITSMIDGINRMADGARKAAIELASLKKELMMPGGAAEYSGVASAELSRLRGVMAFTKMIPRPLRMLMSAFPGLPMREEMLGSAQEAEAAYLKAGKTLGPMKEFPEVEANLKGYYPMSWKYGGGGISPLRPGSYDWLQRAQGTEQNPFGSHEWNQMAQGAIGRHAGAVPLGAYEMPDFIKPDTSTKFQSLALHMGSQLSSALANGFQRGFAAGENILKSFTESVLSSLLGIAAQQTSIYAVSGILSLIPGVGTFSGIAGALGGLFSQGTARPGISSGGGGVGGQLESINSAIRNLDLRVDSVGLSLKVREGNSIMADRVG